MDGNDGDIVDWVRLYEEEAQQMYSDEPLGLSLCALGSSKDIFT